MPRLAQVDIHLLPIVLQTKTEPFCTWQGFLIGLVAKRLVQWFNSFSAIDAAQVKSARIGWSRCMSHSNASCFGKRQPWVGLPNKHTTEPLANQSPARR